MTIRTILAPAVVLAAVTVLSAAAGAPSALAQESPDRAPGPAVLEVPASVRAGAIGNAFALSGRDQDAIFYNPAFVTSARGISGGFHRFGGAGSLTTISGQTEWWGGGVGIGIRTLGYAVEEAGGFPPSGTYAGERDFFRGGTRSVSELAATVGYGRTLLGMGVGLSGTFVEKRVAGERGSTLGLDFGAVRRLGPANVSLAVQNLGPGMELLDERLELPWRVTLGGSLASSRPVGPFDVSAAAAVVHGADGRTALNAGSEVEWWPISGRTFVFRIGHRGEEGNALTLGGGFVGDRISLDYAHQSFGTLGRMHRIGVGWR